MGNSDGQTVNIASRVQNLAVSRSILPAGSVIENLKASELLQAVGIQPLARRCSLRGIADELTRYEIP